MKRLSALILVAAATLAIPSPAAAVGIATCHYDNTNHKVTVSIVGDVGPYLIRDTAGHILLNGIWCDNVATVNNTDSIVVTGDSQSQAINVQLSSGGYKPGRTNEAGKSDEIEIKINLGGGSVDTLNITGTDNADKIDLGQNNSQFGFVTKINFNAGEKTGIDSDVAMVNVEKITIAGNGGNDVIRARGKAGTGPDPIHMGLVVYGGDGDDTIKGGEASDNLIGEEGKDTMWGYGTGDSIYMNDGDPGDVGYGGAGIDDSFLDPGDTWDAGPQ